MSIRATECPHCGAKIGAHSTEYCEYCGTVLPREEPREPARREPSRLDRFDALRGHSDYNRLMHREPPSSGLVFAGVGSIVGALVFVGIAGTMATFFFGAAGPARQAGPSAFGVLFTIVPVAVVIAGIFMLVKAIGGTAKVAGAPMLRTPALIVDKRTRVSGGGEHSRAQTRYFVTIENQDGRREELRAHGHVAGTLASDDIGIAYVKGGHLVAFERVDV